ncbi:hypothetical protein PN36_34830, partial [Candidatus Thiomargarita nelsonii]
QDLDEIRIEKGTYECNGLEIPSSKTFKHGIKVSGGWDSGFKKQSDDAAVTVFDGGAKRIDGIENSGQCEEAGGIWEAPGSWERPQCYQEKPTKLGILTVSADGSVAIEGLSFQNGYSRNGGTIYGNGKVSIANCIFINNSAFVGGAVYNSGNITNSTFSNNSASENGGAVYCSATIINSTFTQNIAENGGAIFCEKSGKSTIVNSTIVNNNGGGFYGKGTILNTIFAQNKAGEEANDITPFNGDLHVDYTLVNNISGALDLGTHIIMGEPRFVDAENGDFHLRSDSPAIDVGDDSVVEVEVDLDGNPRIVGGAIDLGAFERQ